MPMHPRWPRTALILSLAGFLAATSLSAQRRGGEDPGWLERCRERSDRDRVTVCDEKVQTIRAPGGVLRVDAAPNGGITVVGSNRSDIQLTARIQATARRAADAREILDEVTVHTNGTIRSSGPRTGRNEWWSVSFVLEVPRTMDLDLESVNGGISVEGVSGDMALQTTNGGLSLAAVGGHVRGRTDNGGVNVVLEGDRWRGEGLDLETTNGGVRLRVPDRYNAQFEAGTVNGGIDFDFPVTVRGRISRRVTTTLGDGGPPIRVVTTNGGVSVTRR